MKRTRINLVTIRSRDIHQAVRAYQALGLSFALHAHGSGPEHYCCEEGPVVFEIYPLADDKPATTGTRLGFEIADMDASLEAWRNLGLMVLSEPKPSPWGLRAVVVDSDGHRIELICHDAETA